MPGDRVWYRADATGTQQGPFIVSEVVAYVNYKLADTNGKELGNLATVHERELELVKAGGT